MGRPYSAAGARYSCSTFGPLEPVTAVEDERGQRDRVQVERVVIGEEHDRIGTGELVGIGIDPFDIGRQLRLVHVRIGDAHVRARVRRVDARSSAAGRLARVAGVLLVREAEQEHATAR